MEKFSYEANGYNKSEVNKFVDDVIMHTEGIIRRVKSQAEEINKLKKDIERYKKIEETLKSSLYRAEEASNNIKKQALDEAGLTEKMLDNLLSKYPDFQTKYTKS